VKFDKNFCVTRKFNDIAPALERMTINRQNAKNASLMLKIGHFYGNAYANIQI
jgi:hypothetical protein